MCELVGSQLRTLLIFFEPLKRIKTDLNKAKDNLDMIHEIVLKYSSPSSGLSAPARRLWYCTQFSSCSKYKGRERSTPNV